MIEAKWTVVDEVSNTGEDWRNVETTAVTIIPGGIVVRCMRRDMQESKYATSSVALCFVPGVSSITETDEKVFLSSE